MHFILGDWGTSARRLYLCRREGETVTVLEEKTGQGVKYERAFELALASDISAWVAAHGRMPVILSGMIGSNIGWVETTYAACPAGIGALSAKAVRFEACGCDIIIAPGLSCLNPLGLPDVMRGEEIQLLGWKASESGRDNANLACLPGTHTKWAAIDAEGHIETFITGLRGEMFALLCSQSILIASNAREAPTDGAPFEDALKLVRDTPDATLMNTIFATRARQVVGNLPSADAPAYLCGLLVGFDVRAAIDLFRPKVSLHNPIPVIGSTKNVALYLQALDIFGLTGLAVQSVDATSTGLIEFAKAAKADM